MSSRIALRALSSTRIPARRLLSTVPPSEKADEILNKLPNRPNLITKTGTALLGTGLAAAAISQELYVVNEETVLLVGTAIFMTYVAKAASGPYSEWAQSKIDHMKNVLNSARAEHVQAVKDRIENVERMKDVVDLTTGLFALSKDTARLEADTFVLKQKVALSADVKAVLDSWVRFEQQQKESEQAQLTKTVIEKVLANLKDDKTQRDILNASVAEIEQMVKSKAI